MKSRKTTSPEAPKSLPQDSGTGVSPMLDRGQDNRSTESPGVTSRPRLRIGILPKILISFLCLSVLPLLLAGYFGVRGLHNLGSSALKNTEAMGQSVLQPTETIRDFVTGESVFRLDAKSTENIEVRTIDAANHIATFLYGIDNLVRSLRIAPRTPQQYLAFYEANKGRVLIPGEYIWDAKSKQWVPQEERPPQAIRTCQLDDNGKAWHYNPPSPYAYEWWPLFRELTYYDLNGTELLKIVDGNTSAELRDISKMSNTFCQAEHYFLESQSLQEGEIYVSPVVAPYERFWDGKPGVFNPDEHSDKNPREYAYAGRENPLGRRSEGIIRWVTPIFENGQKIGYATAALNHRHIRELVEHIHPTPERFTELHDGGSGNYAFLWDNNHRAIVHPRGYSECGYDPQTGEEVPGWTSETKLAQLKSGRIPLDGRVLDFAPQCKGWANITEEGGNGSFQIWWSGLYKLTTVATVPYRTGSNYNTPRGFGYLTIGANVDDFHKTAFLTEKRIEENIAQQRKLIGQALADGNVLLAGISKGSVRALVVLVLVSAIIICLVSVFLSLSITRPLKQVSRAATAMGNGDLNQHIEVTSNDEVRDLGEAFNTMVASVREVDRMKSEFVTVASHELRTPIHAMVVGVSSALDGYCGDVSDEVREELLLVNEGITRLTRLIDDLLNVSRMEAGKMETERKRVKMEDVVETAVSEVADLARNKHHTLVKRIGTPGEVIGDRDRLTQAVVNLLGNSIKYTPAGGRIVIELSEIAGEIAVSVSDDGYGIPEEAHERVFEKFFQADSLRSKEVGGTGLGLPITKEVVRSHHGRIVLISPLRSEDNPDLALDGIDRKGTRFTITLPRLHTDDTDSPRQVAVGEIS